MDTAAAPSFVAHFFLFLSLSLIFFCLSSWFVSPDAFVFFVCLSHCFVSSGDIVVAMGIGKVHRDVDCYGSW